MTDEYHYETPAQTIESLRTALRRMVAAADELERLSKARQEDVYLLWDDAYDELERASRDAKRILGEHHDR